MATERPEESLPAVFGRAREAREDASALRGESRQARRHAAEIRTETTAILDAVADMMARVLRRRGFALRVPGGARFRMGPSGSTGIEIIVRLEDPGHAAAAKAALLERFPDPLADVIVY
jgi:hypothetical protein